MKSVVLYAHPPEPDGLSLQGHFLWKGLLENNYVSLPCNPEGGLQKEFWYKNYKPEVAYGIGYWGNVPLLVHDPLKYGVTPVPWFNADGWVANYHDDLEKLPLMFTTSEWVRQTYKRDGVNIDNMVPMHIGLDTNNYRPINDSAAVNKVKELLGVKPHEKMILTIGGDVTSKGAQEMFKALAKINEEFKDWKYVCKSWPSECANEWHNEESNLVEELGIKDKVIFTEGSFSTEFIPYLLNACDFYAAPSRLEGFGMIQVEAMACGKPVISIDHMGPSETILNNKTGFLAKVAEKVYLDKEWVYPWMGFPKKEVIEFKEPKIFAYRADVDELSKFSLKLLTDDKLREEMGKNAREHVVKNFHYTHISKKIAEITKEKLGLE
jgi:alpha-maltose-1-phosphate synthase